MLTEEITLCQICLLYIIFFTSFIGYGVNETNFLNSTYHFSIYANFLLNKLQNNSSLNDTIWCLLTFLKYNWKNFTLIKIHHLPLLFMINQNKLYVNNGKKNMYCSTHCLAKMLPLKLHREIEEKYLLFTLHNIGKNDYKIFSLER